jgi:hypothetical protein
VLLDLVPAIQHQPDLFEAASPRRQKLSPLIDRINARYGRGAIGFGLLPLTVRAFSGHAAFPTTAMYRPIPAVPRRSIVRLKSTLRSHSRPPSADGRGARERQFGYARRAADSNRHLARLG